MMVTKLKTAEEKLKNSIGMQLQFYTHSGETIEATVYRINELAMDYAKEKAIEFEGWINDNGWIRDPFPREGFNDDELRYSNIATIDINSNDGIIIYTVEKLYELFSLSQQKSKNNID